MALPLLLAGGAAVYTGFKMLGKLFGSDPDFTQAWMINSMSGRGGFLKTFFQDGMGSLFMGSRTASAMYSSMGMPFGASLYGAPFMAGNPYMANPYMMGAMPYSPLAMGRTMWGV